MKTRIPLVFAVFILLFWGVKIYFMPAIGMDKSYSVSSEEYIFNYEVSPAYRTFVVFMGGDVEIEGFFEVAVGITYGQLFSLSGFAETEGYKLSDRVFPKYDNKIVLLSGICCNINYTTESDLLFFTGDAQIARAIAEFIKQQGATDNKYDLVEKGILTEAQFESIKNRIYALRQ